MAVTTGNGQWLARGLHKQSWLAVPNGNTGNNVGNAQLPKKTVQVTGTFGAGGSISLEGSNDGGTTWAILNDEGGAAITFTAAGMKSVRENPELIRPHVTAGDGTTAINVYLVSAPLGF